MRGSIVYQVQQIYHKSGIARIGQSKHLAKQTAGKRLHAEGKSADFHTLGEQMGIYSYATADAYRKIWRLLGNFVKAEFGVKDMEKLSDTHVQAYLALKVAEGVAHATLLKYAAACEKLEVALNGYAAANGTARTYSFANVIAAIRSDANGLRRFEKSRAYADPTRLILAVNPGPHQLLAAIQQESGCRIKEVNHLSAEQLMGFREDPWTGQVRGYIQVKGKGGKIRQIGVSPETYKKLKTELHDGNRDRMEFNFSTYRGELKRAAEKSGQNYEGSHGLRWSWAQERFQELQLRGMTYAQAVGRVSCEMGHDRCDITEHYLR